MLPGLVLRPQDGADPGTPEPLCYLDWFSALKMVRILEHLGHFDTCIGSPPSRWCGSWNTWATLLPGLVLCHQDGVGPGTPGPLCYLYWFSAFKMAWVLEHLGHFATWIGSPPSRWWGSWNTGATLVPGLVLSPQDGVGPGTPGPLCYLDGLAALKMAGVLEYVGHQGGRNRQQQGDNHHACTRCQLFMKLNSKIGIVHNQLATKTLVEFLRNQMVVFCNFECNKCLGFFMYGLLLNKFGIHGEK